MSLDSIRQNAADNGQVPTDKVVRVFLCHNSKDKEAVKRIADALELDFGIPHFLDAYAIPTGEAFIPWIENALNGSTGCAIFLGKAGWGPTHFWEAGLALERQRRELDFKILPVALPGLDLAEADRLGSGTLFREVNWADFTGGLNNPLQMDRLRAALTGESLPGNRGPDELTPYQVRRDAGRWDRSKRRDGSILYRGPQLRHAERLAASERDILGVPAVSEFLVASAEQQARFWRRMAVAATVGAVIILCVALIAWLQYTIAEQRRLESSSRQIAMLAREANGADRALLASVQAYRISPTVEATRALFEQDTTWSALERIIYPGAAVEALAALPGGRLLAGTAKGDVQLWDVKSSTRVDEVVGALGHGRVTAMVFDGGGVVWIGRESGLIETASLQQGALHADAPARQPEAILPGVDQKVLSFAADPAAAIVAAGTGAGEVILFDSGQRTIRATVGDADYGGIRALAFGPDSSLLLAGTQHGRLLVIDAANARIEQQVPGFDGGIMSIGVNADGSVSVVTAYGVVRTLRVSRNDFTFEGNGNMPALASIAVYNPAHRLFAIGDAGGNLHLRDTSGFEEGFGSLPAHRAIVRALAFDENGDVISAAGDGTIMVFTNSEATEHEPLPPLPIAPAAMRVVDGEYAVLAAGADQSAAGLWGLKGEAWVLLADLLALTGTVDPALLAPAPDAPAPDDGFIDLSSTSVVDARLDRNGAHVLWSTIGGGVIWLDRNASPAEPRLLARLSSAPGPVAISGDGLVAALTTPEGEVAVQDMLSPGPPVVFQPAADIRSMALDSVGLHLALGLEDGRVELVSLADDVRRLVPVATSPIGGIMFTEDDALVIGHGVTDEDRGIAIVPVSAPEQVSRLQVRLAGGAPSALAASVSNGYLVAGDLDGQVLLWRLQDRSFVTALSAGGGWVSAVALGEEPGRLVTAADMGMRAWNLSPEDLAERVCKRAGRDIMPEEWTETMPGDPFRSVCDQAYWGD
jgi:WD40 repeat protein